MGRILIVDDTKFIRTTLSAILQDANFEVVGTAANGKEAVQLYQERNPDLTLMDITMPIMDGLEAIKAIKAIDQEALIVVCSAMGQQKIVVEAIELGAKDFIVKPFEKSRVIETVKKVLNMNDGLGISSR